MRASKVVVTRALGALEAAGLVTISGDRAQYAPVSDEVAALVEEAERLYASRPDAVRRAIVSGASLDATAFANAFRLRKN